MEKIRIEKATMDFLKNLDKHNDRVWFNKRKGDYEAAKNNVELFVIALVKKMNQHDDLETTSAKNSLYRIYNDVRFSKDKAPYNPRFAGYFRRVKPHLRGGYYFWIKPGASKVGCGFVYPNATDLKRIREDISGNLAEWKKLLKNRRLVSAFGELSGEKVKTVPRGFSSEDPAIELLRLKQFWFERHFTDREVIADDFLDKMNNTYKCIRPFFDYMSEVLATNANGERII